MNPHPPAQSRRCPPTRPPAPGYTLIELLVVISIITVLAGLILAVMPGTAHWRTRRGVESQMQQLETLIQRYKDERGYYPPSGPPVNGAYYTNNLLVYELVGCEQSSGQFTLIDRPRLPAVSSTQIQQFYGNGLNRILNSSVPPTADQFNAYEPDAPVRARSFHAEVKENQLVTDERGITRFKVSAPGPMGNFNAWNYRVPGVHNPESFDLWADVLIGNDIVTLGNWKEGK